MLRLFCKAVASAVFLTTAAVAIVFAALPQMETLLGAGDRLFLAAAGFCLVVVGERVGG